MMRGRCHQVPPEPPELVQGKGATVEQQEHAPRLFAQKDGEQCRHGKIQRHRNKVQNVNINAELNLSQKRIIFPSLFLPVRG